MVSYSPHVGPLVAEAEFEVSETIDRRLSGNSTDYGANLILQRDVFVAGSLGDEVRTFQVERPEFVGHGCLVRISQRLERYPRVSVTVCQRDRRYTR